MPRIRKKTSKRGTTNDRKKITQKVRETRKKRVKAAKKNVEWKSKQKKDPGIPNTFPYKDQILAEVAEQRRLAAEDKQRRKDAKKGLKSADTQASEIIAEEGDDDDGFDGIASISAKRLNAKAAGKPDAASPEITVEEEDEVPILINRELQHLQAVLDHADAVVEVLDARDPLAFHSPHLEEIVRGKKILLVMNKIDRAPQEAVKAWLSTLRKQQPTFPFRSSSACLPGNPLVSKDVKGKGKAKDPVDDALGADEILKCLGKWAEEKQDGSPFAVAVVGVTNTGKSALINSLTKKYALPVYTLTSSSRGPTTTIMPQEMTIEVEGKTIRFIDTPGFTWDTDKTSPESDEIRARDILLRNKGRIDRLKDPLSPVSHLVSRANSEDLMLLYSLPAFPKGDIDAFVSGVARSQQLVRKRGALDLAGASKTVLRDWCIGKISWYSTPPSEASAITTTGKSTSDTWLDSLYAEGDTAILAGLESRKNMRKAGGLVRISPGQVDGRKVLTDVLYVAVEDHSDDDDEDDEEDQLDGMDVDEEADEDEEEDEDEEDEDEEDEEDVDEEEEEEVIQPPISRSQKRKRLDQASLPPNKKVSFAATKGKSSSKGSAAPKSKSSEIVRIKKTANALSKSRPQKAASGKTDGAEYDFGKYF